MADIKIELKNLVQNRMLPEVESYIEDLHKLLEQDRATEEDMTIIKEMESFMVELENILEAIERNVIEEDQAVEVYDNMMALIKESEDGLHA